MNPALNALFAEAAQRIAGADVTDRHIGAS